MSTVRASLTQEQFGGIAAGYGDAGAMAVLAAGQLAKRKALIAMVLRVAAPTPYAGPLGTAAALLTRAEASAPDAVAGVLAHPHLDAWATLCLHRLADRDEGSAEDLTDLLGHLSSYAAAGAIAAGLPFDIELPTLEGAASVPGLGRATGLGEGRAHVCATASGVRFTGASGTVVELDGPGWQPRRSVPLAGGWRLAVEDLDPFRHCYESPPLAYLGEARAHHLEKLLVEAWQLIEQEHPGHAVGIRHSLRSIVPLATPENGTMISAASRHACGSVGLSIPDTAADLALLLIHEHMHAKLGALLDLVDLHRRTAGAVFHAPWRLDPRPAGALLQGIYAHAGVTDYWRQRRRGRDADTRRAAAQFAYWRAMNQIAVDALADSAELTNPGMNFVRDLRATLDGWEAEQIDPVILSRTRLFVTAQAVRWLLINARASAEETERFLRYVRFGAAPGEFAERGEIRPGTVRGPAGAPGILGEMHRWLDGRTDMVRPSGPDPVSAGMMLLGGDAIGAERACLARLDADAADDDAWIGLAVARTLTAERRNGPDSSDPATRILRTRPELLRNVVQKMQHDNNAGAASQVMRLAGKL